MREYLRKLDLKLQRQSTAEIVLGYAELRRKDEAVTALVMDSDWKRARMKAQRDGVSAPVEILERRLDYVIERDGMVLDPEKVAWYRRCGSVGAPAQEPG